MALAVTVRVADVAIDEREGGAVHQRVHAEPRDRQADPRRAPSGLAVGEPLGGEGQEEPGEREADRGGADERDALGEDVSDHERRDADDRGPAQHG